MSVSVTCILDFLEKENDNLAALFFFNTQVLQISECVAL